MYSRDNPSKDYSELVTAYQILHTVGNKKQKGHSIFAGISLCDHLASITEIIRKEKARSLLDYGCGKGWLYSKEKCKRLPLNKKGEKLKNPLQDLWQLDFHALYDPGYEEFRTLPKGKYDAVICTDVIEHIDEKDAPWVLEEIFTFAKKFVYVTIACYEAKKTFDNGRNVHVNVKKPDYWNKLLKNLHEKHSHLNVYYSLDVLDENSPPEDPLKIVQVNKLERK